MTNELKQLGCILLLYLLAVFGSGRMMESNCPKHLFRTEQWLHVDSTTRLPSSVAVYQIGTDLRQSRGDGGREAELLLLIAAVFPFLWHRWILPSSACQECIGTLAISVRSSPD